MNTVKFGIHLWCVGFSTLVITAPVFGETDADTQDTETLLAAATDAGASDEPSKEGNESNTVTGAKDAPKDRNKPAQALTNSVTVNVGYADGNPEFGRYSGLDDEEAVGNLIFDIFQRGGEGRPDNEYYSLSGDVGTYGVGVKNLDGSYGRQGNFDVDVSFYQVNTIKAADALTPFTGTSSNILLPEGWDPVTSPGDPDNYTFRQFEVERSGGGLEFEAIIAEGWSTGVSYRYEQKDGRTFIGAGQGFYGPSVAPAPVDFTQNEISLFLTYATRQFQLRAEYLYSSFENNGSPLNFEIPTFDANGAHLKYPPNPMGTQQMALEPDNTFHQFSLNGGYSVSPKTRVTGYLSFSSAEQDERLLAYSAGEFWNFATTLIPPSTDFRDLSLLPRTHFGGEVEMFVAQFKVNSSLTPKLKLNGSYRYEDKENDSSTDIYNFLFYTDAFFTTDSAENHFWANQAPEHQSDLARVDLAYRLGRGMKLRGGIDYEDKDRTTNKLVPPGIPATNFANYGSNSLDSFTNNTDEIRYWAEWKLTNMNGFSLQLKGHHADRDNDLDEDYEANVTTGNRHALAEYYLPRDQDRAQVVATYSASMAWGMSVTATQTWNDYTEHHYGLKEYDAFYWNLDVQYTPNDTTRFNAFIGQQESEWLQLAREDDEPVVLDWLTDVDDDNLFAGIGVDIELIEDKLKLKGQYSYSSSEVDTMITDAKGGEQIMPRNEVTRHVINLDLEWAYTDRLDIVINYLFEDRDIENWAWDKTKYLADYAFGWAPEDFSAHYFTVGVRLAF